MIKAIELTSQQMTDIKQIEVDILLKINQICKKHSINYSLTGGTLLGAVRHKGYIPWDDDIDIMMLRYDYEKFKNIAEKELGKKYIFVDAWNNKYYGLTFGKVMNKNTLLREVSISTSKAPAGVFVDIFPIDKTYDEIKLQKKQFDRARSLKRALLCRGNYYFEQNIFKLILYRIRGTFYRFIPKDWFLDRYTKNLGNIEIASTCISVNGTNKIEKETFPIKLFAEYKEIEFENYKFMSISDTDTFLKILYGDYMKLPPEDQRVPHHLVTEIDLKIRK